MQCNANKTVCMVFVLREVLLFTRANILNGRFSMCSVPVKITLFYFHENQLPNFSALYSENMNYCFNVCCATLQVFVKDHVTVTLLHPVITCTFRCAKNGRPI